MHASGCSFGWKQGDMIRPNKWGGACQKSCERKHGFDAKERRKKAVGKEGACGGYGRWDGKGENDG